MQKVWDCLHGNNDQPHTFIMWTGSFLLNKWRETLSMTSASVWFDLLIKDVIPAVDVEL